LQGKRFWHQFAEDHVHEGDQTEGDADGNAVGIDEYVRNTLQELEAFDEMSDHGLADPAEGEADDGDAELHTVDDFVQVAVQSLQNTSADAAGSDQLLDAGLTDTDQGKFGSGKEGVGRYQSYYQQDPEQHKGDHLRANFNISGLLPLFSSFAQKLQWVQFWSQPEHPIWQTMSC
jgi:hypothetical protein